MKKVFLLLLFIVFGILQSNSQSDGPHRLEKSYKAVANKTSTEWIVYADSAMEKIAGKIFPDDTVVVSGWSKWSYYVECKTLKGYIPWWAVTIIKPQSPQTTAKIDTIPFMPHAELSLSVTKAEVYVGECLIVTLDFFVYDNNRVPLKFHQLGQQREIILKSLHTPDCWRSDQIIQEVRGVPNQNVNGQMATMYRIASVTLCPTKLHDIAFPTFDLGVEKLNSKRTFDKLIHFHSLPMKIQVNPVPPSDYSKFDRYQMIGKFNLTDSFEVKDAKTNFPVTYRVTVSGEGLTFPITAPPIKIQNALVELDYILDRDTIIDQKYFSSKSFFYTLYFAKPGLYDLTNKISLTYFDFQANKVATLHSRGRINVSAASFPTPVPSSPFYSSESLILIDGSQSMLIEDYKPNRLQAVTQGLNRFLLYRKKCDIGLIEFAGYPKFINVAFRDSCYYSRKINSISWMSSEKARGTAIGEAIVLAVNYSRESLDEKKIVVIGDGDNTSGLIDPEMAAQIAKEHHIKIFSLGIGTKGLAPYGKDQFGRPQMVDNTFSDLTLKRISSITGGEYFWAKDSEDVAKFLKKIFP